MAADAERATGHALGRRPKACRRSPDGRSARAASSLAEGSPPHEVFIELAQFSGLRLARAGLVSGMKDATLSVDMARMSFRLDTIHALSPTRFFFRNARTTERRQRRSGGGYATKQSAKDNRAIRAWREGSHDVRATICPILMRRDYFHCLPLVEKPPDGARSFPLPERVFQAIFPTGRASMAVNVQTGRNVQWGIRIVAAGAQFWPGPPRLRSYWVRARRWRSRPTSPSAWCSSRRISTRRPGAAAAIDEVVYANNLRGADAFRARWLRGAGAGRKLGYLRGRAHLHVHPARGRHLP